MATIALAAVVVPWAAGAVVALHVALEHSAAPAGVEAMLHGHGHDAGTPPHDHALTPAGTVVAVQMQLFVALASRAETVALTSWALDRDVAGAVPRETASPPEPSASSISILRI